MKNTINFQRYAATLVAVLLAEHELDRHFHRRVLKLEKEITIVNRFGLYLRPAAMFARTAMRFHSEIRVAKNGNEVDGKSAMSLISLAAGPGAGLRIRIEGADAHEAMCELEQLAQSRFEEDSI